MEGRPEVDFAAPLKGGRPLKRWRWVGAFTEEVMVCAAQARIAGVPVSWWAIWDRTARTLAEETAKNHRHTNVSQTAVTVQSDPHQMQLSLTRGTEVETISPHGSQPIWTRKTPLKATGSVTLGDRRFDLTDAPGLMDESAGYHARRTDWRWSAGVGTTTSGEAVTWNFVTGLHDAPEASERTVWIDGTPHHVPPQRFAEDLTSVGDLQFAGEASRTHRENRIVLMTDYQQPFGSFTGTLPPAGELESGYGVMERHAARW